MANPVLSFNAIGTKWDIEIFEDTQADGMEKLRKTVMSTIDSFDRDYSRFRADSWVTRMSREAGSYTVPQDARPMLDLYQKLYGITEGQMTPLIGQTLVQAGYDAEYSLKPGKLTAPPKWDEVMTYDYPNLKIKKPALLDFGAAGKGYLVDIVGSLLDAQEIQAYVINAGGDILYKTHTDEKLEIALEHPADRTSAIGVATLHNQSICGSSGSRRAWGEFNHIISPRSLTSPRHIAGVWVVAASALLADALTTALYFVEPIVLSQHFAFAFALVRSDMSLEHSADFPAKFFTANLGTGR